MENLKIDFRGKGQGLHIAGFPEAKKVISLKGEKAQKLADLALHLSDINKSEELLDFCLANQSNDLLRSELFKMAIVHLTKCFKKNNARPNTLDADKILQSDQEGLEALEYFINLRDKNIAHDDNAIDQCLPAAILNPQDSQFKIAKVVTMTVKGEVDILGSINNLKLLIGHSRKFIEAEYDNLCNEITKDLEALPYERLESMEELKYSAPQVEDFYSNRKKHI